MKRLFMFFSLMISSFFLFNSHVSADVITTTDDVEKFITEDFLNKRNIVINFAKENNYDYLIMTDLSNSNVDPDYINYYFFDENATITLTSTSIRISSFSLYKIYSDNVLTFIHNYVNGSSYSIKNTIILDSSRKIYSSDTFNIVYNDNTYVVDQENSYKTYYDLYMLDKLIEDPHQDELDTLKSFYNICIEKIEYLSSQISYSYIYLSILAIFILIFVIELIRRYLM